MMVDGDAGWFPATDRRDDVIGCMRTAGSLVDDLVETAAVYSASRALESS